MSKKCENASPKGTLLGPKMGSKTLDHVLTSFGDPVGTMLCHGLENDCKINKCLLTCWVYLLAFFFYNATRYHSSENTKLCVESSLELVQDLLGIVGSLVGMAGSLLGVAWDCWEVLEAVGDC